jgi:hypothetical protein
MNSDDHTNASRKTSCPTRLERRETAPQHSRLTKQRLTHPMSERDVYEGQHRSARATSENEQSPNGPPRASRASSLRISRPLSYNPKPKRTELETSGVGILEPGLVRIFDFRGPERIQHNID